MAGNQTFSESWYRIANQKISLRLGVKTRRQNFRGERWIVLENPFSNQFYRLRPAAYEFVSRLRPDRTVQDVWDEVVEKFPEEAPGQESVIQLLSQLYFANLLQYDLAADSAKLFERYKKRKQREARAKLLQIMFMRIPLFDPDRFLKNTLPYIGKMITPIGGLIWLLVVGFGLKVVADNWNSAMDQSNSVLAPSNLFYLYIAMVFIKTFHEFGHAYFCRKYGGEVHIMGVMLLIFTPIPYMDATSSWSFRSRWKRALVGAAGMIVEIFVAAIAAVIWANTSQGVVNAVAYNVMFIASVSTLLFNANPLLRFDGYYILSDVLDIPNLHQRSSKHLRHLVEHYVFGVKNSESPTRSKKEAGLLTVFGIAAGIYRIVVFATILLFVADQFLLVGIIMAVICIVSWVIAPIWKFVKYLSTSPQLDRVRLRAVSVSIAFFAVLILCLNFIHFPYHFRAPGVIESTEWSQLTLKSEGQVEEILATPGEPVKAGDPLIRLSNRQLELQHKAALANLKEVETRIRMAIQAGGADVQPLKSSLDASKKRIAQLEEYLENLVVRASQSGEWVAPGIESYQGRWLARGTPVGLLINPESYEFVAVVQQDDVDFLFNQKLATDAELRFRGKSKQGFEIKDLVIVPAEQYSLPSAALGWSAGGSIPVKQDDGNGTSTTEPFFRVTGKISESDAVMLHHGRTGMVRFDIGSEPLIPRWIRRFRQLLQSRYQI